MGHWNRPATVKQIENRRITKAERERLKRLAALPDDPLHRVLSRLLAERK
jgi:hypothetical protein